jgi:ketopantoate reductase
VLFIDQNGDHARAMRERGIAVDGFYGPERVGLAPHLTAGACVISLQNGMNEPVIAELVGPERTMGALPDYGGAYLDPGVLEAVHEGTVYVGEMDGSITPRAQEAARLLGIGHNRCELLTDINGRLWTKQVYNSQIVSAALVDSTTMEMLGNKTFQRLAAVLVREAMRASDAAGARLHADQWFDPALYRPQTPEDTERLLAAYDRLAAHLGAHRAKPNPGGYRYVKRASGIHWDIVYRKRKSEAAYLTVTCLADRYGVPIPLNRRLSTMIGEIENGGRVLGWRNVEELGAYADALGERLP